MSSAVCLIDTSIFCSIIGVPHRSQSSGHFVNDLAAKIRAGETLLLPIATIIEAGNHVAQSGDGTLRRKTAERYCSHVLGAISGNAPWVPTPLVERRQFQRWLSRFPDCASVGISFGDLTIIETFELECKLHPDLRVYIWSADHHLAAYDRRKDQGTPR